MVVETAVSYEPRIRLGMVGGGTGAFIGAVHRSAARIDHYYDLVAGALSSTPDASRQSGLQLGLDPSRIYDHFKTMAAREAQREDGIEAVSIVTPNHLHYPVAKAFLQRGIHVICDKPLTSNLADAKKLYKIAQESGAIFVLTHNYTGYPMVRQAQAMVKAGEIGDVRLVQMEYPQSWLAQPIEQEGQKQAIWRTDPKQAGGGGAIGDIGTHAYHLGCFISGLKAGELSADLHRFGNGRELDDNAHVMMRFTNGAKGLLWCSQVAIGCENDLKVRVYGTTGSLEWVQTSPDHLWFTPLGESRRLITRNGPAAGQAAARVSRLPAGHPEGYLEGFATIYLEAARAILARRAGRPADDEVIYPGIEEGLKGMEFIEGCLTSSKRNGAWVKLRR